MSPICRVARHSPPKHVVEVLVPRWRERQPLSLLKWGSALLPTVLSSLVDASREQFVFLSNRQASAMWQAYKTPLGGTVPPSQTGRRFSSSQEVPSCVPAWGRNIPQLCISPGSQVLPVSSVHFPYPSLEAQGSKSSPLKAWLPLVWSVRKVAPRLAPAHPVLCPHQSWTWCLEKGAPGCRYAPCLDSQGSLQWVAIHVLSKTRQRNKHNKICQNELVSNKRAAKDNQVLAVTEEVKGQERTTVYNVFRNTRYILRTLSSPELQK